MDSICRCRHRFFYFSVVAQRGSGPEGLPQPVRGLMAVLLFVG
jgi:hypothetical protein